MSRYLGLEDRPQNPHRIEAETPRIYAEYLRFLFVRNPWARLFSSFNYAKKMSAKGIIKGDFVREVCRDNPDMSFRDFVMHHLSQDVVRKSGHFRPQIRWITQSAPQFIGRVEQIDSDLNFLSHILGTQGVALPHANRSAVADYRGKYSGEMVDKVASLYKDDIAFLGYGFES